MDYCPGSVVFRAGLPVALIDFDLAWPTTRLADVVNAIYRRFAGLTEARKRPHIDKVGCPPANLTDTRPAATCLV
jgi:Ser/Thr protein kinase RdoA (MazF antagonist)